MGTMSRKGHYAFIVFGLRGLGEDWIKVWTGFGGEKLYRIGLRVEGEAVTELVMKREEGYGLWCAEDLDYQAKIIPLLARDGRVGTLPKRKLILADK